MFRFEGNKSPILRLYPIAEEKESEKKRNKAEGGGGTARRSFGEYKQPGERMYEELFPNQLGRGGSASLKAKGLRQTRTQITRGNIL